MLRSPASVTVFRATLTAALALACGGAFAQGGLEQAKNRNQLIVGISYIVPEYKAGMKFRTPEAIDTELAKDLAARAQLPLTLVRHTAKVAATEAAKAPRGPDIVLTMVNDRKAADRAATIIPTGYSASPMAIMRSDTDIKSWEQLKGRKVCVSEGGPHVGTLAAKYGAVEKVQKAPADSLLALRVGACDAAVHDSAMLEELVRLPEWKKFSARLTSPSGQGATLAFVVPADSGYAAFLKQVASEWAANRFAQQLTRKAARQIAFEVYLDQDVPDCH